MDRSAIERQVGRLLGSNERAAGRYRIQIMDEPNRLGGLKLLWSLQFRTILDELHRIQSTDVVLPVAGEGPRELRIRCIVRPEPDRVTDGPPRRKGL